MCIKLFLHLHPLSSYVSCAFQFILSASSSFAQCGKRQYHIFRVYSNYHRLLLSLWTAREKMRIAHGTTNERYRQKMFGWNSEKCLNFTIVCFILRYQGCHLTAYAVERKCAYAHVCVCACVHMLLRKSISTDRKSIDDRVEEFVCEHDTQRKKRIKSKWVLAFYC